MPESEINPTVINQQSVDTGQEITPDGNPIQQAAAPLPRERVAPTQTTPIEETPTTDTPVTEDAPVVEQPVTEKESPIIDINAFLNVKGEPEVKEEKKEEVVETTPTPKQEVEKEVETTPVPRQQPQHKQTADSRDYSGIDEADIPLFKKMGNESFAKMKQIYAENKQQKTSLQQKESEVNDLRKGIVKVPDSYYEHPQAFVLTPEFAKAADMVQKSNVVLNHWRQQLRAVKGGASKFQFLGKDQQGNFVTQEMEAGPDAEMTLQEYYEFALQQYNGANADLKVLQNSHAEKSNAARQQFSNWEKQAFAAWEHPEHSKALVPLTQKVLEAFPAPYRNNPLASALAKALVLTNQLILERAQLVAKQPTSIQQPTNGKPKHVDPADVKRGGPTSRNAAGEGGANGKGNKNNVSLDDFNAVKNS